MRILVTGGAGFIGSHLVERLLANGHQLTVLDDLNDFYAPAFKRQNLEAIRQIGPIDFHEADICDQTRVLDVFQRCHPELVVHLAARAGVRPSLENPLLYENVNVRGTMVLLEACRSMGVSRFVFASSSSIYGISNNVPFSEKDQTYLPISPYAATKLAGETMCYTYSHLYGLKVVCLRFFTVYGPRQRPDLAIRKFTEMIDRGESIPVFGDGTTGRDYTHIRDIVDGITAALSLDSQFSIFNLGNAHPVDLNTVIGTIEHALGKKAVIRRLPLQAGDVPLTYADISSAQRVLGYSPKISFSDGIKDFVEWHQIKGRNRAVAAGRAGSF